MIQIKYKVTPEDYLEMLKEVRFTFRRRLVPISVCVIGLLVSFLGYEVSGPGWVAVGTLCIVLIGFQFAVPHIVRRRVYHRNPRLFGMRTTTFDDNGLTTDSEINHVEIKWVNFERLKETKNLFLLFQTRDVAGIVPKRAFADEAQVQQFRSLASSKVPAVR